MKQDEAAQRQRNAYLGAQLRIGWVGQKSCGVPAGLERDGGKPTITVNGAWLWDGLYRRDKEKKGGREVERIKDG